MTFIHCDTGANCRMLADEWLNTLDETDQQTWRPILERQLSHTTSANTAGIAFPYLWNTPSISLKEQLKSSLTTDSALCSSQGTSQHFSWPPLLPGLASYTGRRIGFDDHRVELWEQIYQEYTGCTLDMYYENKGWTCACHGDVCRDDCLCDCGPCQKRTAMGCVCRLQERCDCWIFGVCRCPICDPETGQRKEKAEQKRLKADEWKLGVERMRRELKKAVSGAEVFRSPTADGSCEASRPTTGSGRYRCSHNGSGR